MSILGLARRAAGAERGVCLRLLARATSTSASGRQTHAVAAAAAVEGVRVRPRPLSEVPGPPIFPVMGSVPFMMMYRGKILSYVNTCFHVCLFISV